MRNKTCAIVVLAFADLNLCFLAGCGRGKEKPPGESTAQVSVVTVQGKDTPLGMTFLGQTESSRQVEIRTRVNGFLEKRVYTEGATVKAGQVMFEMERNLFSAQLNYVQTKGSLLASLVNVYKSMGGGWVMELDRKTPF